MENLMESQFAFAPALWRPLAALTLASLVVMGSPGPSTISVTAVGASFGIRHSINYACGLIAGAIVVLLMVSAGVVALALSIPFGARVLNAIAAVYICFLAFRIATAPPLGSQPEQMSAPAFAGGFFLAIANPKAWLAIAAVFAGTTVITDDRGLDAVIKTALLSVMIVIIHVCWLLAGASLSRVLRDPLSSRLMNISLAATLMITTLLALMNHGDAR
jgi:threonine/homoserine/homoserine lactone efflux protein